MSEKQEIRVGVASFPPLVIKKGDSYEGFEIELWQRVCAELDYVPKYSLFEFKDLLPALADKKVDIAIAGITRTEQRERSLDFSHRTLDSGLSILVNNRTQGTLMTALKAFFSKDMLNIFLMLLVFTVLSAHLIWFAERGGDGSISSAYFPGIGESLWWAVVTVSTVGYGDFFPVTWAGRIIGTIIILSGLAIFGLYIGKISSALTLQKLRTDIKTKDDLNHKSVVTLQGTAVVEEVKALGAVVTEVKTMDEAYEMVDKEEVPAAVFDTPVILHHIKEDKKDRHAIAGEQFHKQTYGFAFRENESMREEINRVLLHLRESGEYERLQQKWF